MACAKCSSLVSCCDSKTEGVPEGEMEVGVAGWKKVLSCEAAMKIVKAALRARIKSWKGRSGGCVERARRGLISFDRSGEE